MKSPDNTDSLQIQPNTVLVIAKVLEIEKHNATLEILQVKAQGQGIVNVVSQGDKLEVSIADVDLKTIKQTVEVFLKEELGTDASKTTYRILEIVPGKRN